MSPTHRAPMDPRYPGWDHPTVDDEPPPVFGWEHRRPPRPDGAPGPAIIFVIVGIPLLALILIALAWLAASRPVSDPPGPSQSGTSLRQQGDAVASQSRADSWAVDAPPPPPAGGGLGTVFAPAEIEVHGLATWYDAPSSRDSAAGPALRRALGSHWRGSTVKVCADGCVTVRLTDWCACGSRHGKPTVIDLDDVAFGRIAKRSAGVATVTITVVGQIDVPLVRRVPTAPPTDLDR